MSSKTLDVSTKPKNVSARVRRVKQKAAVKSFTHDEFMAAAIGDTAWLKQALKGGKDATMFDRNGLAAIHLAALHGRLECLTFLVESCQVDVNLPSSSGWRPLHLSINSRTGKSGIQCVQYLLEQGANSSLFNDDMLTPCHQAAIEGSAKCLEALIAAGADINLADDKGHTPLDYAKIWGHRICARLLASEGWKKDKEIQSQPMMKLNFLSRLKEEEDNSKLETQATEQEIFGSTSFTNLLADQGIPAKQTGFNSVNKCHHLARDKSYGKNILLERLHKANSKIKSTSSEAMYMKLPQMESNRTISPAHKTEIRKSQGSRQETSKIEIKAGKGTKKALLGGPDLKVATADNKSPKSVESEIISELPQYMIDRLWLERMSIHDRPLTFKCRNIIDAQHKKLYEESQKPLVETYAHISDCVDSELFPRPTEKPKVEPKDLHWSEYDVERMTHALKSWSDPGKFPAIQGNQYTYGFEAF